MTNRNHRLRSASFDITSLHYYSHCQPPPLLDENESQFTKTNCNNNIKFRKSHSVHDLPSQLEFQIELKLRRRLKLMKEEEGGANNNDEAVVEGSGDVAEVECNETDSEEEFIGEVEHDDESIGEQHYDAEDDFTEDELVRNLLRRQPVVEQPQQQQCTLEENESDNNNDEYTTNDYESSFMERRRTTDCSEDTPRVGNVSSHLVVGVVDEGMECCNEIEVERVAAEESDNVENEASSSQDRIEEQVSSSSQMLSDDVLLMPPTIEKMNARHDLIREMGGGNAETKGDMEAGLNKQDEGKNGGIAEKIGSGGDMTFSTATSTITANSSRLGAQDVDVVTAKSESDDVGDSQSNQCQEQRNEEDQSPSPQPTTDDDMMQSPMEEKRNARHDGLINQMVGNEEQQLEKKGDEGDEEDKKGNGKVRVTKEAISGSDDIPLLFAKTNTTISSRTSTAITTTSVATTSHSNSKSKTTSNKTNNNKMDVLTEGQYFLSISMLVYMYSHLRETCRMGHTRVKMEEIDCNNSIILGGRSGLQQQQCGSPVRMFSSMMESMHSMESASSLQQSQQSSYLSNNNNNTVTAGAIIRVVIDELEDYDKEQHTNDYYYQANSHHREYEESIMKEFRQWIEQSRVSQLDSSTQDLIASLRKKVAKARWKRAMTVMRVTRASTRRFSDHDDNDVDVTDDGTKNPNKEQMVHYLRRQVARYRWKRVIAKVRLAVRLGGGICPKFDSSIAGNGEGNRYVNMNKLLKKGLENDPKYFMDGSVMSNLIESSLEVVWFSDFTQNDVVYGICVQREEKKITVVFRGTVNAHNWSMNLRYDMMEIPNPVENYYPGRAETLNLHCGFALYLLRRRKDTRRSKMDEIFEKIEQIGKELSPDGDYKLCITGHSMGGALATLFGFFLGAKLSQSQQTKSQEILIYTFASPRVGGESFLYAYQHLERAGLIRHARFSCTNDIVPLIPFSNLKPDDLKFYKHVGMRVQLHNTGPIGKWRLRRRLDVSYPLCHDWSSTIARGLMNCLFGNPNTPRGYKQCHTVTEYQTRLHFALTYRKALASTVFFLDERRQRLKRLDEYYAFRGTMNINVYSYVLVPRTDGLNIRKRVERVVLVIPLMYTWTRLLSVVTSAEIPKIVHWVFIEQLPKVVVVAAVPFLLMQQYLLILSLGLAFIIEVIKIAIKIPNIRWGGFKKMSGRLILVAPLLNVWVKFFERLTNVTIPKNVHRLILQQIFNLWKLLPFFVGILFKLLQLSFGLSFVVVALGIPIRARSNRWRRSLGKMLLATPMLVAWVYLFSAAYKNMVSDDLAARISNANNPGWGLVIEATNAAISKNFRRLILQQIVNLWQLVPFFASSIYKLLQLSFGLSFVVVALGIPIRARNNRWRRSLGKILLATIMLVAWVFLFSSAYKKMASDDPTARVSNPTKPGWGINVDNQRGFEHLDNTSSVLNMDDMSNATNIDATTIESKLTIAQGQLKPLQEYATGIMFTPTLDNGLYLVGAGVRKKSVIKVYAVAMYSTPNVLASAASSTTLHDAARIFDSASSMTTFVLEMVYSAGAEKIAGAIAESVKPRYDGAADDIGVLESLIVEGVNAIGGQATKGTTFRFDCSEEGVAVSVNGAEQGMAAFNSLGSAFVDVFMDGNTVSPTLVDSCVSTWSTDENKSVAASLVELAKKLVRDSSQAYSEESTEDKPDKVSMRSDLESQLKSIQEYATSVIFDPKIDDGLYLVGAGVRKKSVVKVYAVALYSSAHVLNSVSSPAALHTAARTFDTSTPVTSFVLEMVYSASAEKIGGAIADSVKPRHSGSASDISVLESLIVEGVNKKGGQATKGTTFRFDCSEEGVTVTVDGSVEGAAIFTGLGSAFVDVFLDDNAVSPTLVSSCMDTWSNPQAQATAASLLELDELDYDESMDEQVSDEEVDEGPSLEEVESQLQRIQEYATSVVFDPKLDDGLYLVGAGVRKKSVVKVYAVALYSSAHVLNSVSSPATLRTAARTFDGSTPTTSFVLEMVYSASAEKIGGAIADSVKPRYDGSASDIDVLESLIVEGVNKKGGQATKGTTFRFDCSEEGVTVSVDGSIQGAANFAGLGSAFVDVFLDDNAVSPTLVSSCMDSWSNPQTKATAALLLELDQLDDDVTTDEEDVLGEVVDEGQSLKEVESQLQPIQEYATGIMFTPTLDNGLYLVGAGVRKKSVIKVYAVAMYSTPNVLLSASSSTTLRDAARIFDSASSMTSFVLEMVYSAGAEKIAGAIAESVKPRYDGAAADIGMLESLIVEGVNAIGGQATKGTTFHFDCSEEGVVVSVNGVEQGMAALNGLGSAFVDVFMDGNTVSPTLVDSCVSAWSSDYAKLMATTLVGLNQKIHHSGNDDKIIDTSEDEVVVDTNTAVNATATEVDEPNESTTIPSKEYDHGDEKHDMPRLKTSQPKQKHNILKKVVKFAFPVF